MADWTTISSLGTGAGTMVLAIATFSAVRSANRSAMTAERTLLATLRPFLVNARVDDPIEKIMWGDEHWASVGEGRAVVEVADEVMYLALPLRNAGTGLAVIHGWHLSSEREVSTRPHADPDDFRRQSRDLYIAAGDTGFWQGALREDDADLREEMAETVAARTIFSVDVLYSDSEGGQRTVSRFSVTPRGDEAWTASVTKHWHLDRADPR